ncbi:MAG: hypothetical protein ACR2MZ_08965 [Candidatus Dormibacter sp.]|uniref:hypothetical protein n=1 Tax=Candidatus Dormibacter sp. TaxID=2973982 RepID=UPI000DB81589|nr:MAG: hypothetical protein DLM66_08695 [Candidatus Dormibacteraeota bacterium]
MRKLLTASAILALITIACGPGSGTASQTPSGQASCVNAQAPHRAYVVVEHLSGRVVQACVGFQGDSINGPNLMKNSGVEFRTSTTSLGLGICQVDNEPAHFDQCFPPNAPYWDLLLDSRGQPAWQESSTGLDHVQVADGGAIGWQYRPQTGSPPALPPLPKRT